MTLGDQDAEQANLERLERLFFKPSQAPNPTPEQVRAIMRHRRQQHAEAAAKQAKVIYQTTSGRLPLGGFRPGQVVQLAHQTAFVLGRTTYQPKHPPAEPYDCLDVLWVDSVGYIVILQYTPEQLRSFGNA